MWTAGGDNTTHVKPILAPALLAALGFGVAGCGGSGHKAGTGASIKVSVSSGPLLLGPIAVSGTTTISDVQTGTLIRCKGWTGPGVKVPRRGAGVAVGQSTLVPVGSKSKPSRSHQVSMTHRPDGSVAITCGPTH